MRVLKFIYLIGQDYLIYIFGIFIAMCFIVIDITLKPFLVRQLINDVSTNHVSLLFFWG